MWRPGRVAPEYPVAVGVRGGQVVAGGRGQFAPWFVERVRQYDLDCTDADGDQVFGDVDVVPGESDDTLDLLPEDEDENRGSTVPCGEFVGVDDTVHRLLLVGRAHPRARSTAMALDLQIWSDQPGLDRPAANGLNTPRRECLHLMQLPWFKRR